MADLHTIVGALATRIDTALTDVDTTSVTSFLPSITTEKIGLVIPPFGQRDTINADDLSGATLLARQRVQLEFWCKRANADDGTLASRARNVALSAAVALMQTDGTGYELDYAEPFVAETEPLLVEVGNVAYLVVRLYVTVRNYAAV